MSSLRRRLGLMVGTVLLGLAPAAAAQATAAQAATPSAQDTQYLQALHQVNLAEEALGGVAQQKGQNEQVKQLGSEFATDHKNLDKTVQKTASSTGVTLPKTPNADQQAVVSQLKTVNGTAFDTQWVTAQLVAHRRAITDTQTEISQGSDQAVQQVAQEALPALQQHYDSLVALAQSLGIPIPEVSPSPGVSSGSPSTGGTRTPAPGNS